MNRPLSWLARCVLLVQLACTSDGVVGEAFGCDAACAADQVCDPLSNSCTAVPVADSGADPCPDGNCLTCPDGSQDCELPDECDDCASSDSACIALFCRSCDTSQDCLPDEPICLQGRCIDL